MNLGKPHIVALIFCYLFSFNGLAQSSKQPLPLVNYNQNVNLPLTSVEKGQLLEVFGDEFDTYVLSRPNYLKSLKNILRNRVEIIEFTNSKDKKECTPLSEVSLFNYFVPELKRDIVFNKASFNPLKYNFKFFTRGAHMYWVDNTNYYIIVKSQHQR